MQSVSASVDKTLFGIVRVNADVPAVDLDADKALPEINTKTLSEIDDCFCTVSSDTHHEN